jgi:hypothetical protein
MDRLRLPLFLGIVLAVGAPPLAKGQDGSSELDRYKTQEPEIKHDKSKDKKQATSKNNDGHRKHWWSLPHFRHKKQDSNSNARTTNNARGKAAAVKPVNNTGAPKKPGNKTAALTRPGQKPQAKTGQGAKAAAGTNPNRKTIARTGPGSKSAAGNTTSGKTVAGTNQAKKTVRHNCSPDEAKKGGCQAEKRPAAKGTTSPLVVRN